MGTLANTEDPDERQPNAAFHQGLHCLLRLKQPSSKEMHHSLENFNCDPLKYTMGSPILIVSICMGKSIEIGRVNRLKSHHIPTRQLLSSSECYLLLLYFQTVYQG